MEKVQIRVGESCTIKTKDGRTYVGTFTGYAEVGKGEAVMEEVYLAGCGDGLLTVTVEEIQEISPEGTFSFPRP